MGVNGHQAQLGGVAHRVIVPDRAFDLARSRVAVLRSGLRPRLF
jgi:hypothetical protein